MNLAQFFRILWARRMIILISTAACFLAGIVAVTVLPRKYSATSRIMLDIIRQDPLGANNDINNSTFAKAFVPGEVEMIHDYRVAARAAKNLGWDKDPETRAAYNDYRAQNAGKPDIQDFDHWLAGNIAGNIAVNQYLTTNVIDITYFSPDPDTAAQMANVVRQAYVDVRAENKREDARDSLAWLDRQMEEVRKQSKDAEDKLVSFQRANGVVLLPSNTDAESARLQALAQQTPNLGGTTVSGAPVNPNAATIAALDAKIATESQSLGPNHPVIQDLRRQRAALAAAPVAGGMQTVTGPSLNAVVSAQGSRVLAQSDKVEEAKRLQSQVAALSGQYSNMAARAAALRQQTNANDFTVVMMDAASPPTWPDRPKIPLVLFGSFALGLGLGVLVALVTEFLRRRVRSVADLSAATNVPVIAVINAPPSKLAIG